MLRKIKACSLQPGTRHENTNELQSVVSPFHGLRNILHNYTCCERLGIDIPIRSQFVVFGFAQESGLTPPQERMRYPFPACPRSTCHWIPGACDILARRVQEVRAIGVLSSGAKKGGWRHGNRRNYSYRIMSCNAGSDVCFGAKISVFPRQKSKSLAEKRSGAKQA